MALSRPVLSAYSRLVSQTGKSEWRVSPLTRKVVPVVDLDGPTLAVAVGVFYLALVVCLVALGRWLPP